MRRSTFDDFAQIHHDYPVRYMLHNCQIVSDKNKRASGLLADIVEQIDHRSLYADIEGGNRFISYDKERICREGAGDAYALTLTSGKLVRITVEIIRIEPHSDQQFSGSGSAGAQISCSLSTSSRAEKMLSLGFSEP